MMHNYNEFMKSKIPFIIFALFMLLFLGGRYIYYGSLARGCIYTENKLPVPEKLVAGIVVVAKDAYLAIGADKEHACLNTIGKIDREIVAPEIINNPTIGRRYFTDRGLSVRSLKKGSEFKIVDVIAVTKHGLSTIDSGPGPIYYLILQGKDGLLYQIATVSLGLNKEDLFLAFVDNAQNYNPSATQLLSPDSFDETYDYEGANSLEYTGKLTSN